MYGKNRVCTGFVTCCNFRGPLRLLECSFYRKGVTTVVNCSSLHPVAVLILAKTHLSGISFYKTKLVSPAHLCKAQWSLYFRSMVQVIQQVFAGHCTYVEPPPPPPPRSGLYKQSLMAGWTQLPSIAVTIQHDPKLKTSFSGCSR